MNNYNMKHAIIDTLKMLLFLAACFGAMWTFAYFIH